MYPGHRGFTVIEILIAISLLATLAAFTLVVSFSSLRNALYHSDRDLLIAALLHARAEALAGVCESGGAIVCSDAVAHGVHIDAIAGSVKNIVVFQGAAYDASDEANVVIPASGLLALLMDRASERDEIIFQAFSGEVSVPGDIVLVDQSARISTTTIGGEGQIFWTH